MAKKKGLTIGKARSALYGMAKIFGDVQAVKKGSVVKRAERRTIGKLLGKLFNF